MAERITSASLSAGGKRPPLFDVRGVDKRFGAVQALKGVDLRIERGSVHALIGENGAGKSTLAKILSGVILPDRGTVLFEGKPYRARSPREAREAGVSMIHQESALAPHLTVEENIGLGVEQTRFGLLREQRDTVRRSLALLGHADLELAAPVSRLGVGQKQIVEIARSLFHRSRCIVMDEPTSSLSADDVRVLFRVVRTLRDRGVSVIYISHFLEEILDVADRYTVLRDGESVGNGPVAGSTLGGLVSLMVGRPLKQLFVKTRHAFGDPVLSVRDLRRPPKVEAASFTLRRGEILGIAGLVGSGRTDMLRCLFGLDRAASGTAVLSGKTVDLRSTMRPAKAIAAGLGFLSENRYEEGLALRLSVMENLTLSTVGRFFAFRRTGILRPDKEQAEAERMAKAMDLKTPNMRNPAATLSGGNQQKAALGRILLERADVLLFDEPTRGIDVRSKAEIYRLIGTLAARGKAVVMVSSYLPELFGVCDTLAVMYKGRLSPSRPVRAWTERSVMAWATTGKGIRQRSRHP